MVFCSIRAGHVWFEIARARARILRAGVIFAFFPSSRWRCQWMATVVIRRATFWLIIPTIASADLVAHMAHTKFHTFRTRAPFQQKKNSNSECENFAFNYSNKSIYFCVFCDWRVREKPRCEHNFRAQQTFSCVPLRAVAGTENSHSVQFQHFHRIALYSASTRRSVHFVPFC